MSCSRYFVWVSKVSTWGNANISEAFLWCFLVFLIQHRSYPIHPSFTASPSHSDVIHNILSISEVKLFPFCYEITLHCRMNLVVSVLSLWMYLESFIFGPLLPRIFLCICKWLHLPLYLVLMVPSVEQIWSTSVTAWSTWSPEELGLEAGCFPYFFSSFTRFLLVMISIFLWVPVLVDWSYDLGLRSFLLSSKELMYWRCLAFSFSLFWRLALEADDSSYSDGT